MSELRGSKVLSCASCRQRKIKCDKIQPICTQCLKVKLECSYPSRKKNKRIPRPRHSDLLERINRLETIVGQADPEKLQQLESLTGTDSGTLGAPTRQKQKKKEKQNQNQRKASSPASSSAVSGLAVATSATVPDAAPTGFEERVTPSDTSKTPSAHTPGRYLSDEFWGNLCDEVDGIKQALEETSEDDDEDEGENEREGSADTPVDQPQGAIKPSGSLLGNPNYNERQGLQHPDPDTILSLWNIYLRHVDPVIKILHRPTVQQEFQKFVTSTAQYHIPASTNALFFTIYLAAVTTMDEKACLQRLGHRKTPLVNMFRAQAEQALAAADYLTSSNMTTLQAATLYVIMLRGPSTSRASWVLVSLLVRLGQALHLHRDGDGSGFSPYEAEMRRRLWYFIAILDVRAAEDRGTETVLRGDSYNIALPTNIDDDDFGPHSTEPLVAKSTPGDSIVALCLTRCVLVGQIIHPQLTQTDDSKEQDPHTEGELTQIVRALETDFIHTADHNHPGSHYAAHIARVVILKLWLIVHFPYTAQTTMIPPTVSRETPLITAVSILEMNQRMVEPPYKDRFSWFTNSYVQWHPLAVTLAELCVQTEGELVNRAWRAVDHVFPLYKAAVADSSSGSLWRPIKKLYKRASAARPVPSIDELTLRDPGQKAPLVSSTMQQQQRQQQQEQQEQQMQMQQPVQHMAIDPSTGPVPPVVTTAAQFSMPGAPIPGQFDAMDMDPSYLFQYQNSFSAVNFDPAMAATFSMAPWNEFVSDAQMYYSPSSGESV